GGPRTARTLARDKLPRKGGTAASGHHRVAAPARPGDCRRRLPSAGRPCGLPGGGRARPATRRAPPPPLPILPLLPLWVVDSYGKYKIVSGETPVRWARTGPLARLCRRFPRTRPATRPERGPHSAGRAQAAV